MTLKAEFYQCGIIDAYLLKVHIPTSLIHEAIKHTIDIRLMFCLLYQVLGHIKHFCILLLHKLLM